MRNLRNTKIVFEYLVTLIVFTIIAFVIAVAVSVALDKEWDNQMKVVDEMYLEKININSEGEVSQ